MDEALHRMVEEKLNRQLIASQRIASGSINQVYRLTIEDSADLILRRAPSQNEIGSFPSWLTPHGLRREQAAIKLLADLGSILPETVVFHESDDAGFGDWVLQSIVPGRPAVDVIPDLTIEETNNVYVQFGKLTRAIHDVRGSFFGPPSNGQEFSNWNDLLAYDCAGFLRDAEFVAGLEAEVESLLDIMNPVFDIVEPVLIHSDLNLEHLFLEPGDAGWQVSGLIDLEFARFADPLSEGFLHSMMIASESTQTIAFREGYGDIELDPMRLEIAARLGRCWDLTDRTRLICARSDGKTPDRRAVK